MKKILLTLLSLVFKVAGFIGVVACIGAIFGGEEGFMTIGLPLIIVSIILLIAGIIIGKKTKNMCWCGAIGRPTDADYVGTDYEHNSTDYGYTKREIKRYSVTYECPACGRKWAREVRKNGALERHHFN